MRTGCSCHDHHQTCQIRAGETDAEVCDALLTCEFSKFRAVSVPHSFKLEGTVHASSLHALLNSNYTHLANYLYALFGFPLTVTKGAATLHDIHAQQNIYETQ